MQAAVGERCKVEKVKHKIILTKEHGSWAVLLVPIFSGIAVSSDINYTVIPLVISLFFLFMSYTPAEILLQSYIKGRPSAGNQEKLANARYWFSIFISIALFAGIISLAITGRYLLLIFAAAASALFFLNLLIVTKIRKNAYSDFLAMAGLTLSAPAIVYFLDNSISEKGLQLWLLNVLFFGSSAFYVHMKMKFSSLKKKYPSIKEKLSIGKLNLLYQSLTLIFVLFFAFEHLYRVLIVAAFLPAVLHAILGTFILPEKVSFKKVGMIYVVYSIIFLVLISITLK